MFRFLEKKKLKWLQMGVMAYIYTFMFESLKQYCDYTKKIFLNKN